MTWPVFKHVAALALLFSWLNVSQATIAIIGGANDANIKNDIKDATIFGNENDQDNSNGAGPGMFSGTDGTSSPLRGLVQFDVAGNVPAGATIFGVQLQLSLGMVAGAGGGGGPGAGTTTSTIALHKLSTSWGEGTTGSGDTKIGGTGQGFAAAPGDATWNASSYPNTLWTTPGGDYSSTISAFATVGTTVNAVSTWGTTPTMVADVQGWLADPATNFGWELVNADETSSRTFRAFWTKEASDPTLRPELLVTYSVLPGDVNNDGIVNSQDLAQIASAWMSTAVGGPGDANFDGIVNGQDLALVSSNWLHATENATTVPEPATYLMIMIGGAAMYAGCRRLRRPPDSSIRAR